MTGSFTVLGSGHDANIFLAKHIAQRLEESHKIGFTFTAVLEIDYLMKLKELRLKHGGKFHAMASSTHCVYFTQTSSKGDHVECIGEVADFITLAKEKYGMEDADKANTSGHELLARQTNSQLLVATGHAIVFLDFIDGAPIRTARSPEYGNVVIELYDHLCPKACANFVKLCSGEAKPKHYQNCPIHRLVPGGWLQCGDVVDGSGNNSVSAMETDVFEDESFSVKFDAELGGVVGYVTSCAHSNGSQFFITLGACGWMNNKFEGFGRVVQGYDTLKRIEAAPCKNQRPVPPVVVGNCGKQGIVH